jgi:hypothetical protein
MLAKKSSPTLLRSNAKSQQQQQQQQTRTHVCAKSRPTKQ